MGANNDGNSLQIHDGNFITAGPTFGQLNKTEPEVPTTNTSSTSTSATSTISNSGSTSSTNDSTHSEQESVSSYVPTSPFKIGAGRDRIVSINSPLDFEAYISKKDIAPRYTWNFGDFVTDGGHKVDHIYRQAGTYEVVLEAKTKEYTGISRTEVQVINPQLDIICSTSTITIHNNAKQEINIGNFVLNFEKGLLKIPRNTIVTGGGSIPLIVASSTVLQSFQYPNGEIYEQFDTI